MAPAAVVETLGGIDQAAASLARATSGEVVVLEPEDQSTIAIWLSHDQTLPEEIPF